MKIDKNGEYRTRDGREVRIYATDVDSEEEKVHGAVLSGKNWEIESWFEDGSWQEDCDSGYDLVPYTPPKKTPEEWFQELPSPIRERAIANIAPAYPDFEEHPLSLNNAIGASFSHDDTIEGFDFWDDVHEETFKPASERNYPALPDGTDDFGNVVPAKLLPLPEAPDGMEREYTLGGVGVIKHGSCFQTTGEWLSYSEDPFHTDRLLNKKCHYIRLVPEKQYWSKPSHFPPVCWVYLSQHEKKCLPVTAIDMELERFHCHGRKTPLSDISRVRWMERPFDSWEEGKECLVE